ncbi:hypothetical protein BDP81DRAFT_457410 [Colletotrichum phormii]|uniref:NAD(P)-binding domain-containing protein n=1 Tax=Colletotrichum phormii TaxID=359342 RepID=A0AAJ0A1B5_9PEZI|nr:uncharacterized protein BDP81DRAFT_457410 [Colletotrichum phormii]KAK1654591.1 hypothetical protein BDP81DRAFT_457410 [Colletotrichum phormii]
MAQNPTNLDHPQHIAIVGAGGEIGSHITRELLRTKKHQITALNRAESTSTFPDGVLVKRVDYEDQSSIVDALCGKDALIITLAGNAPPDQEVKLIEAAAEAHVAWDSILGEMKQKTRRYIESLGKSSWISLVCGFWYEFSLAGGAERFGFDFPNRTVTFYDDGSTKINTSTLEHLNVHTAGNEKDGPTLSQFRNRPIYVSSFLVSQKDMFESVLRVTGATEGDWKIKYQDVKQRYAEGKAEMQKGDMTGLVKLLYARDFFVNGGGNYEASRGLHNGTLSLPREELDDQTRTAIRNM